MSAEPDLLPLPEATMKSYQTDSTMRTMTLHSYSESDMQAYARANVAHATAARDAEVEALRDAADRLRNALVNYDQARTTMQSLAGSVRDYLRVNGSILASGGKGA